jgi:Uma2 family endonuclease
MDHLLPAPGTEVVYPDSEGLPIAENAKQYRWIVTFYRNLATLFDDRDDVLVACNLLWYPEEGRPDVRLASDVFVALGRPKGDRRSYKQWEEGGVPPTVVFEVLAASNRVTESDIKLEFSEDHGAAEFYLYDPHANYLAAYLRRGEDLRMIRPVNGFVSPSLGIRFELSDPEIVVRRPDGRPFRTFEDLYAELDDLRTRAEAQAARYSREAEKLRHGPSRLADLSRKARRGQASAEELRELEQLEDRFASPAAL